MVARDDWVKRRLTVGCFHWTTKSTLAVLGEIALHILLMVAHSLSWMMGLKVFGMQLQENLKPCLKGSQCRYFNAHTGVFPDGTRLPGWREPPSSVYAAVVPSVSGITLAVEFRIRFGMLTGYMKISDPGSRVLSARW